MKQGRLWLPLLGLVLAGSLASALALALPGGAKPPTRAEYLARASAICAAYGRQLDRIPPPSDPSSLGGVLASVEPALLILRAQEVRIRALDPPLTLRASLKRFFALTDQSIAILEEVRRGARKGAVARIGIGLLRFGATTNAAKRLAYRIGYRC